MDFAHIYRQCSRNMGWKATVAQPYIYYSRKGVVTRTGLAHKIFFILSLKLYLVLACNVDDDADADNVAYAVADADGGGDNNDDNNDDNNNVNNDDDDDDDDRFKVFCLTFLLGQV